MIEKERDFVTWETSSIKYIRILAGGAELNSCVSHLFEERGNRRRFSIHYDRDTMRVCSVSTMYVLYYMDTTAPFHR